MEERGQEPLASISSRHVFTRFLHGQFALRPADQRRTTLISATSVEAQEATVKSEAAAHGATAQYLLGAWCTFDTAFPNAKAGGIRGS